MTGFHESLSASVSLDQNFSLIMSVEISVLFSILSIESFQEFLNLVNCTHAHSARARRRRTSTSTFFLEKPFCHFFEKPVPKQQITATTRTTTTIPSSTSTIHLIQRNKATSFRYNNNTTKSVLSLATIEEQTALWRNRVSSTVSRMRFRRSKQNHQKTQ